MTRDRSRYAWLALGIAAVAPWAATLGHGLVLDDQQLLSSPLLGRPFDVLAVWRNGFLAPKFAHLGLYRPLVQWTLLLNGTFPPALHAVNVLLHAAATLFLFAWLRSLALARGIPFAAAFLFAVHPVHVEVVANVSARSESLALLLGLAFLLAHRRGRPFLAGACFLASLWSKESAAAFLGVAVAADLLLEGEARTLPVRRWSAYAGILLGWLGLRALALLGATPAIAFLDNPAAETDAARRIWTAAAVQLDYLRLLAWPFRPAVDYAYARTKVVESAADARVLLFGAIVLAAGVAAILARRRAPAVALAVAGYALLFAVTSNFLFPIGTIEAERLAYAPSACFCLLAAVVAVPLARRLPDWIPHAGLVGLAGCLGVIAFRQARAWKDEGTLFRAAVAQSPQSAKAHLQLAQELETEGDLPRAREEYETSARIHGRYGWTWFLLGNLRHRTGDAVGAVEAWRSALDADPGLADVRANLASILLDLGRRPEARIEARELFGRDPLHPRLPEIADRLAASASDDERASARSALAAGEAALDRGEAQAALADVQSAVLSGALGREDRAAALRLLSRCWSRLGRAAGAERFAEAARRLSGTGSPRDPAPR